MIRVYVIFLIFSNFYGTSVTGHTPITTWPLYYKQPTTEIQQMSSVYDTCPGPQGQLHSSLNYNGLHLHGTSGSYVDLTIGDIDISEEFSFLVFAKPQNSVGGTIFHYRADTSSSDVIAEIMLAYNTTHAVLSVRGTSGQNLGETKKSLNSLDFMDDWLGFVARYDGNKGKLGLVVQNHGKVDITLTGIPEFGQPGTIRVGASFDNSSPGFHGDIICFNLFDARIKDNEFYSTMQECLPSNWPPAVTNQACESQSGYFEIVQHNSCVDSSYPALKEHITPSRLKCAMLCERLEQCVSFTLNVNTGACLLYDHDYTSSVVASDGVHYYRNKNTCC